MDRHTVALLDNLIEKAGSIDARDRQQYLEQLCQLMVTTIESGSKGTDYARFVFSRDLLGKDQIFLAYCFLRV